MQASEGHCNGHQVQIPSELHSADILPATFLRQQGYRTEIPESKPLTDRKDSYVDIRLHCRGANLGGLDGDFEQPYKFVHVVLF